MTQPSSSQLPKSRASTGFKPQTGESSADGLEDDTNGPYSRLPRRLQGSLKAKVTAWAIAISVLPVMALGTTIYFGNQSIDRQIQARHDRVTDLTEIKQKQLLLSIATGVTAVLAGGIAVFLANRLLDWVQADREAESHQRQQKEALQNRVLELLRDSEATVETLWQGSLTQVEFITSAYNQIQTLVKVDRDMSASAQQVKLQEQQVRQTLKVEQEVLDQTVDNISAFQATFVEAAERVKRIDRHAQQLSTVVGLIRDVASHLKLQAMNATFEAARTGEAGQVSAITEEVLSSVRLLNVDIEFKPLVEGIQAENGEVAAAIDAWTEQAIAETQLLEEVQQELARIAVVIAQMSWQMEEISQAAASQAQTWTSASQSVLEVSSIASHTSKQSAALAKSFNKLAEILST